SVLAARSRGSARLCLHDALPLSIGFLFGGSRLEARWVVGLGTAQRNIAAAMVVAIDGFDSPDVLVMVVVFSVVSFAILFPLAWRSEEHTSELQSRENLVCRLLLA